MRHRRFVRLTAAFLLFASIAVPAFAADDLAPAKAAVQRLQKLPQKAQELMRMLDAPEWNAFTGREQVTGQCQANCVLFVICETYHWSFPAPFFDITKSSLRARYADLADSARRFDEAYAPLRDWLTRRLPEMSPEIDRQTDRMLAAAPLLENHNATDAQIVAAMREMLEAGEAVEAVLRNGEARLYDSAKQLGRWSGDVDTAFADVDKVKTVQQEAQDLVNAFAENFRQWPCGGADASKALLDAAASQRDAETRIRGLYKTAGFVPTEIAHDTSVLLGAVQVVYGEYANVIKEVREAKALPPGITQEMRIMGARAKWHALIEVAQERLEH